MFVLWSDRMQGWLSSLNTIDIEVTDDLSQAYKYNVEQIAKDVARQLGNGLVVEWSPK